MFEDSFVIEIGAIKVVNNKVIDTMDIFVRPSRPLSYFTTQLTGITNEMVDEGFNIKEALKIFEEFSNGMKLMAHNARFDMGFINTNMKKYYGYELADNVLDTLTISKRIIKDIPNYKLETLANFFDIDYSGAHRSLRDCQITLEVYNNVREIYNKL